MSDFRSLGAMGALAALSAMGGSGGFGSYEREYHPPAQPRSNRQALALAKALRRKARQTGDES